MSSTESDRPGATPSEAALQRLAQACTELDEAIRRLRHIDEPYDADKFQLRLNDLETYVELWERSDVDLDQADDQMEAVSRSLIRAYWLAQEDGEPWARDAWALRDQYNNFADHWDLVWYEERLHVEENLPAPADED